MDYTRELKSRNFSGVEIAVDVNTDGNKQDITLKKYHFDSKGLNIILDYENPY